MREWVPSMGAIARSSLSWKHPICFHWSFMSKWEWGDNSLEPELIVIQVNLVETASIKSSPIEMLNESDKPIFNKINFERYSQTKRTFFSGRWPATNDKADSKLLLHPVHPCPAWKNNTCSVDRNTLRLEEVGTHCSQWRKQQCGQRHCSCMWTL